jgi:heterodisulfide reductase subunit A-like polyferredoxin/coenzyme F420-reducing hydrogenase delta subunit
MSERKVGVYICTGCGIDLLDIEKLVEIATDYPVSLCRTDSFLCENANIVKEDIKKENLDAAVIAACSPRVKTGEFSFDVPVERVNLREQVVWSHPAGEMQSLAEDYLKMGISKAQKLEREEGEVNKIDRTILIVGGGITGITAAVEAAEAGYEVILVEKEPYLGGRVARMNKYFPKQCPPACGLEINYRRIKNSDRIKVYTSAEVEKVSGAPGDFDVTVRLNPTFVLDRCTACGDCVDACPHERPDGFNYGLGKTKAIYLPGASSFPFRYTVDAEYCKKDEGCAACVEACRYAAIDLGMGAKVVNMKAGSVIVATGWKPYDASKIKNLGFERYPDVITNVMMERLASPDGPTGGRIVRPSDGKEVRKIAFVQCAGSRDENHLPYCSAVCCLASLKQASYVKEQYPDAEIYIFYIDVRTPAKYEEFYRKALSQGFNLIRGKVAEITDIAKSTEEEEKLIVRVEDTLLGKVRRIPVDMVVLAVGMVPNNEFNLDYRQGGIPQDKFGFFSSNFICFPYETQRTGIYSAGCVRQPMDVASSVEDASGAVLKSIQCLNLTEQGMAVHPRSGDFSYPDFFLQRCTQCKRCTEECPFSALEEDEKGTPILNPTRCRRCGTCFGACPERIISFKNYTIDMISSMIREISVPEEEEMRVLAFFCENDAYPALDMAGLNHLEYSSSVRIIPVRCLGSVNVVWIADALSRGIDGILLAGCKSGEDYQCHFIKGSELANRRMENVRETLDRLMLEPERVKLIELEISDYKKIPEILNDFVEELEKIGPNPYKGF